MPSGASVAASYSMIMPSWPPSTAPSAMWHQQPVFSVKGHDTIINCIDGCGGMRGAGAPEIATGSRDGCVHVGDPRQRDQPVASMEPEPGAPIRDCWAVAFGDAHPLTQAARRLGGGSGGK